jgi:hypothetical protein
VLQNGLPAKSVPTPFPQLMDHMTTDSAHAATGARLSRFWAYAAAYGALWGAVEVTAGSFLHALRVPFSGVLLASLGAALLVAQRQVLDLRGLTLATGAVAALCKSLSPAGIIWNPMIAIVMEALLVEAALFLAPRSRFSAAAAGSLAAAWAVAQGLLMQYIVYGRTIFDLYVTIVGRTTAWFGVAARTGWAALACVALALLLLGASSGLWGRRVGRVAFERLTEPAHA